MNKIKKVVDETKLEIEFQELDLDPEKLYVASIEIGTRPAEACKRVIDKIREILVRQGIKNVIFIPTSHGDFVINFEEAEKFLDRISREENKK